jgi:serine/threonine protein kinase
MPLYPATMHHMPCLTEPDALQLGQQLLAALGHMHACGLAHCDIKAPNVFIDAAGAAHLGDFGAARSIGADVEEQTPSHVPVDAGGKLDVGKASPALDFFLLAVTLMERLGWLQLGRRQLTMSMVDDGMRKATTASLREFLLHLLP